LFWGDRGQRRRDHFSRESKFIPRVQDDPRYFLYLFMRESERKSIIAWSFLLGGGQQVKLIEVNEAYNPTTLKFGIIDLDICLTLMK
jgi:hypothetical protein